MNLTPQEDLFMTSLSDVAGFLPPSSIVPVVVEKVKDGDVSTLVDMVTTHSKFGFVSSYFKPVITSLSVPQIGRILIYFIGLQYPMLISEFNDNPELEDKCVDVMIDVVKKVLQ